MATDEDAWRRQASEAEREAADRVAELEAQLSRARAEMERTRTHDTLTGCLSRVGIMRAFDLLRGGGGSLIAIVGDCDDFQAINERLGPATGDLVLRGVAGRLQDALRPGDLLARVAGDRFLALLSCDDSAEARGVAERLRMAVAAEPFLWDHQPISMTISLGMVRIPPALTSIEEILSIGRVAVLKSKSRGKNRVSVPDDTSTAAAWLTPALRTFLAALRGGEGLHMYAQPVVELPGERAVGWEMLVRGPRGPLEQPADLFRMAEEHQLATTLDMLCLRLAAEGATRLHRAGLFHFNVLPVTLLEVPIEGVLEALGKPPPGARWCVELSERQFVGDPQELIDSVGNMRRAGICVAIDDVGSGRGTLDSVIAIEPEVVKLDLRIVRGVATDERKRRMLVRLLRMARALDTEVVAEGVENREDLAILLDLGVQFGQGFLWGRPEPIPTTR